MEKATQSIIYCTDKDTLCAGIDYTGNGACRYKDCILEDPEYQNRQKAIRIRREELLQEEIHRRELRMNRYYTRGWTRLAEIESRELASLKREIRRTNQK